MKVLSRLWAQLTTLMTPIPMPPSEERMAEAQYVAALKRASADCAATARAALQARAARDSWRGVHILNPGKNYGESPYAIDALPSSFALRALLLANDMEDEARRLDAAFADQADVLTLQSGVKSEVASALYVAADLVRQAHAKIKELNL